MQYLHEEFVEILKRRKIVIYGAGSMAGRFYNILCKRQLEGNVVCCAVTVLDEHCIVNEFVQGLEIITLKEARYKYPDALFCVAVHKANKDEMIRILQLSGVEDRNYIWAVPYYFELMLSKAIKKNVCIKTLDIVKNCDDLGLAFRWLALKQYYGLVENGYELYLRSLMIYSNQETAEKRLESFQSLLRIWDEKGYDTASVCKLDEKFHILDGMHRLCAALWHQEEFLICDVYRYDGTYEDFEETFYQDKKILLKRGFTRQEVELAEKTIDEMRHRPL